MMSGDNHRHLIPVPFPLPRYLPYTTACQRVIVCIYVYFTIYYGIVFEKVTSLRHIKWGIYISLICAECFLW